jgi:hypothetical protein
MTRYLPFLFVALLSGCVLPNTQSESYRIRAEVLLATPVGSDLDHVRHYLEEKKWHVVSDESKSASRDGFTLMAEAKKYTTIVYLLPLRSFAYATWTFGGDQKLRAVTVEIQTDGP